MFFFSQSHFFFVRPPSARLTTAVGFRFFLSFSLFLALDTRGFREMGVVFSSLWHWMFPGKEYKIVMVKKKREKKKEEAGDDDDHRLHASSFFLSLSPAPWVFSTFSFSR